MERHLCINTTGIKHWYLVTYHYHGYEPTPYWALDQLFQKYQDMQTSDRVVDFGCGRGRVVFYLHNRLNIPVTGVEANSSTYNEALANESTYLAGLKTEVPAPLEFVQCLAQSYEIKPDENKFYFFNPFSTKIFSLVVANILASVEHHPRSVDIILYYPTVQYEQHLVCHTPFKRYCKVGLEGTNDANDKFVIYRLE